MVLNIITRDGWHAKPPRPREVPTSYTIKENVFFMNLMFETCDSRPKCTDILSRYQLFNINKQRQRDIRFNFMVGGDGNVYEGRGLTTVPLVPKEFDSLSTSSFIIAFLGLFTLKTLPTEMYRAANKLVEYCVANNYIIKDFKLYDLLVVKDDK